MLPDQLAGLGTEQAARLLRELAQDPRMSARREQLLRLAKKAAASVPPMEPEEACKWIHECERAARTPADLFRIVQYRLDDLRQLVEAGRFSVRDAYQHAEGRRAPEERAFQKLVAHELEMRSGGQYRVVREEEVDHRKKPDLCVSGRECDARIAIEVKVADNYSYQGLEQALCTQLVGYLSPEMAHGVLLLCLTGKKDGWNDSSGNRLSGQELELRLQKRADSLCQEGRPEVQGLRVMAIDFGGKQSTG